MLRGNHRSGLRFIGIGMEFAAAVAGLTLLGWWIDRHWGTAPWGLLIGAGLGLVGGMYNMIREALGANPPVSKGPGAAPPEAGEPGDRER